MISNLEEHICPFILFEEWFHEATSKELNDPNAMTLATVDQSGLPNARIVLLKGYTNEGFVFYTNTLSVKGTELKQHPRAALVFHWKSLLKQIRIRGDVVPVSEQEADEYYASRPYLSKIGAHASEQSRMLDQRETFEQRIEMFKQKYPENARVPRPVYWSGFRLVPVEIEFWADRPFRLHDRTRFTRSNQANEQAQQGWSHIKLYP